MDSEWNDRLALVLEEATATDRFGEFFCEPLEHGSALTLGNALRRVLLSSIRGAAATALRIDGALHEFSMLPGVVEDVPEIILNVKGITFCAATAGPHVVRLSCVGPRIACAGDLELPTGLVVLEPEHPIATLDQDGALSLALTVTTGRGYVGAETLSSGLPLGTIAVDGLYSPIRRVAYAISKSRAQGIEAGERLDLSVWTNGAIAPADAVAIAARILQEQLLPFVHINDPLPAPAPPVDESPAYPEHLFQSVDDLTLSVRAANCMQTSRIHLIGDLVQHSAVDILKIRNMGRKTLREIEHVLREIGLSLGMVIPNWAELRDQRYPAPRLAVAERHLEEQP